jgi:hypothetical protein
VGANSVTAFLKVSPPAGGIVDRTTQQRGHFFLNVNDDLGLAQLFGEALLIQLQLLHFFCEGIAFRFRPSLLRR